MTDATSPRFGTMPKYRSTMRHWDQAYLLVAFADGVVIGAYVMRQREGVGWYIGSAVRAACAKYRWRLVPLMSDVDAEMRAERSIAVPEIRAIECEEPIKADIAALNEATASYRMAFRNVCRLG